MAETAQETRTSARLDGIAIGGKVVSKKHYPARTIEKTGSQMEEAFVVDIAYLGGTSSVSISQERYKAIGVGSYQMFLVTQRSSKNGAIYNTSIE